MKKIKILFVSANPQNTPPLQLDKEIREITHKIRTSEHRDLLELNSVWAARPDDLLQALNNHKPDIVHFSGHGSESGEIMLLDNNGQAKPVTAKALKALFTVLKDNIRAVVLNACYSQVQARAIIQVIDCAIGMKDAIGDNAAITFAASFYRAIGFGRSVKESFNQAKAALLLEGIPEDGIPKLLSRKEIDTSNILLLNEQSNRDGSVKYFKSERQEPKLLKYICYLSSNKIANLWGQVSTYPTEFPSAPSTKLIPEGNTSTEQSLLHLIYSGIQFGGRSRHSPFTEDLCDSIYKLSHILRTLEQSDQIGDLNKLIFSEKQASENIAFFTYRGIFKCLNREEFSHFVGVQEEYLKQEEKEAEFNPPTQRMRTRSAMSILHSNCGKYDLYLACSYKYFSDMGCSRRFAKNDGKCSDDDWFEVHPHSGNWSFFEGKHDATFDVILLLTGQEENKLYGSPLVIINAFSPDFRI